MTISRLFQPPPSSFFRLVERDDGVIELHPLASVPADQRWFWTERWQRMEREADADVAAGRVRAYADVDALLTALDR
jgi:hypothetical protein